MFNVACGGAGEEGAQRHRGQHETGTHDVDAERVDEVERQHEDDRELTDADHRGSEVAPRERREREQVEIEEGCALYLFTVAFPHHKQHEGHRGDRKHNRDDGNSGGARPHPAEDVEVGLRGDPAEVGALNDGEDERTKADRAEKSTVNVDAGPQVSPTLRLARSWCWAP